MLAFHSDYNRRYKENYGPSGVCPENFGTSEKRGSALSSAELTRFICAWVDLAGQFLLQLIGVTQNLSPLPKTSVFELTVKDNSRKISSHINLNIQATFQEETSLHSERATTFRFLIMSQKQGMFHLFAVIDVQVFIYRT